MIAHAIPVAASAEAQAVMDAIKALPVGAPVPVDLHMRLSHSVGYHGYFVERAVAAELEAA